MDADSVVTHGLDAQHLQGGLIHLKRRGGCRLARGGAVRAGTGGAWALIAQIVDAVIARVAILPVDLNALRFRDSDMFGVGQCGHVSSASARRRALPRYGAWRPPVSRAA